MTPSAGARIAWIRGAVRSWGAVASLTLVGAGLRFAGLGRESLWNDELATLSFTNQGPVEAVVAAARDTSPPLYYVLQSLANLLVPPSEVSLRVVSACAGTLVVALVWSLVRRFASPATALTAAALVAVAAPLVAFGQEARAYALGAMTVVCVAWTLVRACERPDRGRFVALALACVAAAYTHLFALIAAAGIVMGAVARPRLRARLGRPAAVALTLAGVAWIPWAIVLVRLQVARVSGAVEAGQWVLKPPASLTAAAVDALSAWGPAGSTHAASAAVFVALVLVGALATPRSDTDPMAGNESSRGAFALEPADGVALLAGAAFAVFAGGLVVSRFVLPIFSWRMVAVLAPLLYALAAIGLSRLWRPAATLILVWFVVLGVSGVAHSYRVTEKEQWRPAVAWAARQAEPGSARVASASWIMGYWDLYSGLLGGERVEGASIARSAPASEVDSLLREELAGRSSAVLLLSHVELDERRRSAVDEGFERAGWHAVRERAFKGIVVRVYAR